MSASSPHRGFLHGLTTLPLIGGSVGLIGAPTGVAEPVTPDLLVNYETWLASELCRLGHEIRPIIAPGKPRTTLDTPAWFFHHPDVGHAPRPSTRAALVLSAVGCDWREGCR